MPVPSTRPTWITRFPSVLALGLGMASLSCGVLWRITDKASISGGAFYNHNWIIGVVVVLTAQVGLLLSVSAAVAAPRGSKWRAALPGFAASVVAISFWAFSG